jgi:hypothetical protein
MRRSVSVTATAVLATIGGLALASPVAIAAAQAAAPTAAVSHPVADIVLAKGRLIFKPSTLTAKAVKGCSRSNYSVGIANLTTKKQQLTYGTSPAYLPIPPRGKQLICGTPGTFTFGLKTSKATVTITFK